MNSVILLCFLAAAVVIALLCMRYCNKEELKEQPPVNDPNPLIEEKDGTSENSPEDIEML